jgi:aryl-alcohol dehydrogenase-like predicted oxidoreductase
MKLALGTAQFGLQYGIANSNIKLSLDDIYKILETAKNNGIDTLDTAFQYGESQKNLGRVGAKNWKVISKLHTLDINTKNVYESTYKVVEKSLSNLKIEKLEALLIHDVNLLKQDYGDNVWRALEDLKQDGVIDKLGISIYQPEDLNILYDRYDFNIIQCPISVLDRRINSSDLLSRINKDGKELHARSIFLQGLLLMNNSDRPRGFNKWKSLWQIWEDWLDQNGISSLEACISYVYKMKEVKKVIVGVDSLSQLNEIISSLKNIGKFNNLNFPSQLDIEDGLLLNPSNWKNL